MTTDSIRGSSDRSVLILTSLAGSPKHGYALIKDIEDFAGVTLGAGTLYGALAKLEEGRPGRGPARAGPQAALPDHPGGPGPAARAAVGISAHRRARPAPDRGGDVMTGPAEPASPGHGTPEHGRRAARTARRAGCAG